MAPHLLSCFPVFLLCCALPSPPRDVSPILTPILKNHNVPALVAVITDRTAVVATAAAGVRRRGDGALATLDDKFHIGSDTKAMSATLIGALVEDGTLAWSSTVGDSFPALAGRMHADWKPVKLELLLYNRAGAPGDLDAGGLWGRRMSHKGSPVEQRDDLAEGVLTRAPAAAPGTQFIYSNAGFAIAGHIAESRTGTPLKVPTFAYDPKRCLLAAHDGPLWPIGARVSATLTVRAGGRTHLVRLTQAAVAGAY